jgi:transcriptional regulator with XRE-family HTH domain
LIPAWDILKSMDKICCKKLNNCLRKYRKARGLKQAEVAAILGLKSTSMISRWEKGVCLPDTANALKLAVLYRIMVDALFIDHVREFRYELYKREEMILSKSNK